MRVPPPHINALIEITLTDSGARLPSRVEDVADGDLVLAGPPAGIRRTPGSELVVSWAVARGRLESSARLVAEQSSPQRTWRVRLEGEVRRSNRRSFVRVTLTFPLTIAFPGLTIPGAGLDVSEGGLRCRIARPDGPDRQGKQRLATLDGRLTVRFTLEGAEFSMSGVVVRSIPLDDGVRELGIRFIDASSVATDQIRRLVFAIERRQRANGVLP